MEVFKTYKQVLDHLKELIADALDVNRRHIEIVSISEGEKIGRIEYSIEYLISYKCDGVMQEAKWVVSHWTNGDTTENIVIER